MTANALTTGSLLNLTTSSGSLNSTNGLLQVVNSGASTNGVLAKFQSNSTAGSGVTILTNGQVGIGSTAPDSSLNINKAGVNLNGNTYYATFENANMAGTMGQTVPTTAALVFTGNSGFDGGGVVVGQSDNSTIGLTLDGLVGTASPTVPAVVISGGKWNGASAATSLGATEALLQVQKFSGSALFTVLGGGNVGVGTTTPTALLEVAGPIRIQPAALPGTALAGFLAIDSGASNALKYYNGSSWVTTGGGSGVPAAPGSGAAPGYAFTGFTTTGMFETGTNILGFSTAGNERMRIDANGNLGIGTTNTNSLYTMLVKGSSVIGDPTGTSYNATPALSVVGTDSSYTTAPINMMLYDTTAMAQDVGGGIAFEGNDGLTDRTFAMIHGGKENSTSGNYAGYFSIWTRPNGVSSTEKMRVTSAGNVGIGTTTPVNALDIGSGGGLRLAAGTPGNTAAALYNAGGTLYWNGSAVGSGGSSALSGLTAATATNTLANANFSQVWNWGTATTQTPMTITANTLTTGSLLSLSTSNGTVNSTNGLLSVSNTGASTSGLLAKFQSNSTAGSGMYVTTSGTVGIGTTSPGSTLGIIGNNGVTGVTAQNLSSGGQTNVRTSNSSGGYVQIMADGSTYGYATYQNSGAITYGNTANNFILTDEQTSTGGTAPFEVITGGYANSPTLTITGGNPGTVGIGTTAPRGALDVYSGAVVGAPAVSNGTSTIDFSLGNIQYTASSCGAFTLNNLKDGGTFNFVIKGTSSATCSFTAYSGSGTTGPLTVHLPPGHGATTASTMTLYSFMVVGTDLFVSWVPGY
jgi:hypothetical protein